MLDVLFVVPKVAGRLDVRSAKKSNVFAGVGSEDAFSLRDSPSKSSRLTAEQSSGDGPEIDSDGEVLEVPADNVSVDAVKMVDTELTQNSSFRLV